MNRIIIKKILTPAGILFLLLFLLTYPQESLSAAQDGMKLWLNTLLPTLLPFLILTGLLIRTDCIEKALSPFRNFWRILFGLSPSGAYAFLLGMLCGYPMGAKLASDLYSCGKISKREAEYLLTFANQPSPAFLTTYLAQICLGQKISAGEIWGILLLADAACMLFFRFLIFHGHTRSGNSSPSETSSGRQITLKKETSTASSPGSIIDVSIMNGFETITRLGGYILLFSLISACIRHCWKWSADLCSLILGTMELTTGLHQIALSDLPFEIQYPASMALTAFGGCCIMAQTRSVTDKRLSFLPFLSAKCLNSLLTFLFVLVFSKLI